MAVKYNLWTRRLSRDDKCCFCNEIETVELALFTRDWTSYVWFETLDLRIDKARIKHIRELVGDDSAGNWGERLR